jgi:hypothetical protein
VGRDGSGPTVPWDKSTTSAVTSSLVSESSFMSLSVLFVRVDINLSEVFATRVSSFELKGSALVGVACVCVYVLVFVLFVFIGDVEVEVKVAVAVAVVITAAVAGSTFFKRTEEVGTGLGNAVNFTIPTAVFINGGFLEFLTLVDPRTGIGVGAMGDKRADPVRNALTGCLSPVVSHCIVTSYIPSDGLNLVTIALPRSVTYMNRDIMMKCKMIYITLSCYSVRMI